MRALKFEAAVLVNVIIVNAANTLKVNEKRIKIVITGKQNGQEIKLKATLAAITTVLRQQRKERLKKIQACTEFKPMTCTILVYCSTNWANSYVSS